MQLNIGDIVEGKITGIKEYGLFADLGDGKSGMVHISEVASTYVSDIKEFVKEGDSVKMKVLNITDEGKISLSIKKANDDVVKKGNDSKKREKKPFKPQKPDSSYQWSPKKSEPSSFEEMMNQFKASSDEKFSDLKRKNPDAHRTKRGVGAR